MLGQGVPDMFNFFKREKKEKDSKRDWRQNSVAHGLNVGALSSVPAPLKVNSENRDRDSP